MEGPSPSYPISQEALRATSFSAMERFKSATAARYIPTISVTSTLECDAAISTASTHRSLTSLLSPHLPPNTLTPGNVHWLDAARRLEETLKSSSISNSTKALIDAYTAELEDVTRVSDHDTFSSPIIKVVAAWVAEKDLLANLASAITSPVGGEKPQVVLVSRPTRQDDAARSTSLPLVLAAYGESRVHQIHFTTETQFTPESLATRLVKIAQASLTAQIVFATKQADKVRRAARATFRSWFNSSPTTNVNASSRTESQPRISLTAQPTPMFPPDSVEATTKRLADLYMMEGRYVDALDTYRLLQGDLRSAVGAARVHEGAALEMAALALALVDGSKQSIGAAIEKAIRAYCAAGRIQFAIRATLRGVQFCLEAGFPDSAAGVITRAIDAILPDKHMSAPGGSNFVEGGLAILSTSCSEAYTSLRKHRRASLYAFLAATRFAKLQLSAAAACVARIVDEKALLRNSVRNDVELILAAAEEAENRHSKAVSHCIRVLSNANEKTDVEVQSVAVQRMLAVVSGGARDVMMKRWDSGAMFPLLVASATTLETYDSSSGEDWQVLEDDVLEDFEFFGAVTKGGPTRAKRERRVEVLIAELRKKREVGDSDYPGGSLEMKIRRMRELAESRRRRRRSSSLLERGAVINERIRLKATLRNPLQFPVFLTEIAPVVMMEGRVFDNQHAQSANGDIQGAKSLPIDFSPVHDVTLMPNSTEEICLEVAVQNPGTAKLIGITWRFTVGTVPVSLTAKESFVPGYCLLERRGRRLNDTRQQRASDIPLHEEDQSLTVTVAPACAKVHGCLLFREGANFDKRIEDLTLRAGEKREARLIIENCGQTPLDEIVIRIGTPQTVYADVSPESIQNDNGQSVFAIGLDEEPVQQNELIAAARISVNLQPKEKTEVPVWLRAAVPSSAFGYRTTNTIKAQRATGRGIALEHQEDGSVLCDVKLVIAYGGQKARVTRVGSQMKVRPSIVVSPRFLREADPDVIAKENTKVTGVLLGVEIEHGGLTHQENIAFNVTELSVTSRSGWKPTFLPTSSDFAQPISEQIFPSPSCLRINETATIFILVVRSSETELPNGEESSTYKKPWRTFSAVLSRQGKDESCVVSASNCELSPPKDVANEEYFAAQRASTHFVVCSHQGSQLPSKSPDREQVYVAVGWKCSPDVSGQIHIPPIDPMRWIRDRRRSAVLNCEPDAKRLSSSENLVVPPIVPAEDLKGGNEHPIIVSVHHPNLVEHNFFQVTSEVAEEDHIPPAACPAVVGVQVTIRNVSSVLLDVIFAVPAASGVAEGDRGRYWAGDVSMSLRSMPPGSKRLLCLTAVLICPGKYNMSNFTVLYQSSQFTPLRLRQQITVEPSYMTVKTTEDFLEVQDLMVNVPDRLLADENPEEASTLSENTTEASVVTVTGPTKGEGKESQKTEEKEMSKEGVVGGIAERESHKKIALDTTCAPRKVDGSVSRSRPPAATKANLRSRSSTPIRKLLVPSPDDDLWNDEDTDESDD